MSNQETIVVRQMLLLYPTDYTYPHTTPASALTCVTISDCLCKKDHMMDDNTALLMPSVMKAGFGAQQANKKAKTQAMPITYLPRLGGKNGARPL